MLALKEDSEADIKMYILVNYDQHEEFLWDEIVKCPDCHRDFEDLANIMKLYKKNNYKCHMCGKCLKERECCNHVCLAISSGFYRFPYYPYTPP